MNKLEAFYNTLNDIRGLFHKFGKLNDSNAKLDEISKLLAIYIHDLQEKKGALRRLQEGYLKDKNFPIVEQLNALFAESIHQNEWFRTADGKSIFSENERLNIDFEDKAFAFNLLELIDNSFGVSNGNVSEFDLINEAFGHFVRANFRNHIEDAQYMTPLEVVDFICEIALSRMASELKKKGLPFKVCDPCSGVGTFLATFYNKYLEKEPGNGDIEIIAQDKVPRMVRLTKLNLALFKSANDKVFLGNSIIGDSPIDKYAGQIDLILTNPPFGAKFTREELIGQAPGKYPLLHDYFKRSSNINSEILFIDKCISLLKDGGELFAVVPDSVISSNGVSNVLRHRIFYSNSLKIKSIIELPTVAFAQAGTRTKTSILHLKKDCSKQLKPVFVAKSKNLGFEVSTKKGATVKVSQGENDLPKLVDGYKKVLGWRASDIEDHEILLAEPSAVLINYSMLEDNQWTPNHFSSQRFLAIDNLKKLHSEIELVLLKKLVNFITKKRRKERLEEDAKCISVLHIVNEDVLDYESLLAYKPKYPGIKCFPGDLIFSKINPRIPRSIVVPQLEYPLSCSSEFEIIQTKGALSNYGIKFLLSLPIVQTQIKHLTSGTSSSHNRIKTAELENILMPVPKKGTKTETAFLSLMAEYEKRIALFNDLSIEKSKMKKDLSKLLS